ncbi:hypothetical protein TWF481_000274 [Arthrobotrys musiformis]|uniref:UBX domain-containing protein n=1 Tax=Arthrobotrys musiformis TaxID=47236 RepID=A0AAV9WN17_9PEZI
MATVVVNGPNQRRLNVKVTPATVLNDVLSQACDRFGLTADNFTLRHGKTNVDLTLPFRLSRLGPGAKLDLVRREGGKAGSVITVALQFIDNSIPRMIEKFPSSATLWEILKKFEDNSGGKLMLTERAVPDGTKQGAGRLYYEMPTIHIINRELASLEDLKKSLAALGFTSGTALLRIKFTQTTIPFEEAILQFAELNIKSDATEASTSASASTSTSAPAEASASEPISEDITPESSTPATLDTETYPVPTFPDQISPPPEASNDPIEPIHRENTDVGPNNREISVFKPGNSTVPSAAALNVDEKEYDMSINQARQYQAQLKAATINKRLLTEAQKQKLADEEKSRRLAVDKVDVRVRFPEGSVIQSVFTQTDTTDDLYAFVKGIMRNPGSEFHLALPGPKQEPIPANDKRIIVDLGITHATLLNFYWKEDISAAIKKQDPLSAEYREKARKMEVPKEPDSVMVDEEVAANQARKGSSSGGGGSSSGGSKVPKWLKFGKK